MITQTRLSVFTGARLHRKAIRCKHRNLHKNMVRLLSRRPSDSGPSSMGAIETTTSSRLSNTDSGDTAPMLGFAAALPRANRAQSGGPSGGARSGTHPEIQYRPKGQGYPIAARGYWLRLAVTAQAWRAAFGIHRGLSRQQQGRSHRCQRPDGLHRGGPGEAPRRAQASTHRQTNPIRG